MLKSENNTAQARGTCTLRSRERGGREREGGRHTHTEGHTHTQRYTRTHTDTKIHLLLYLQSGFDKGCGIEDNTGEDASDRGEGVEARFVNVLPVNDGRLVCFDERLPL